MELYAVLIMLMIFLQAETRVSLEQIKEARDAEFGEGSGKVCINPAGPLNLLHGYLYAINGFMQNKRLFSPWVDINYSLTTEVHPSIARYNHVYERNERKDRAYQPLDQKSQAEKYLSEYHKRLIIMFPSCDGVLSIESGCKDSFSGFLRKDATGKQASYILASLLLLSEGVSLDIECTKEEISLKKADGTCLFSAEPVLMHHPQGAQDPETVTQYNAIDVIKFFKKSKRRKSLPSTLEEYRRGDFLNSTQFLIQTYIFEYLESTGGIQDLAACTHEILQDQMDAVRKEAEQNAENLAEVFKRIFCSSLGACKDGFEEIKNISALERANSSLPFSSSAPPSENTTIEVHIKTEETAPSKKAKTFSNCVENAIYNLVRCLLYKKRTGMYCLEKMEQATPEFKHFFKQINRSPFDLVDLEMHRRWNHVVSNLKHPRISYLMDGKNELGVGILNMLLVIAEITGRMSAEEAAILKFMDEIEGSPTPGPNFFLDLKKYAENFLSEIAANTEIRVECKDLEKKVLNGRKNDVIGNVCLVDTAVEPPQEVRISFSLKHAKAVLLDSKPTLTKEDVLRLEAWKEEFQKRADFLGYMAEKHVDSILYSNSCETRKSLLEAVKMAASTQGEEIDRIFVSKKICGNGCKYALILYSLCCAIKSGGEISSAHPIACLVSNTLGSMRIDNLRLQKMLFPIIVYSQAHKSTLPKITIPESDYVFVMSEGYMHCSILGLVLETECAEIVLRIIEKELSKSKSTVFPVLSILGNEHNMEQIFNVFFQGDAVEYADALKNMLEGHSEWGRVLSKYVNILWFILACRLRSEDFSFVKIVYARIDELPKEFLYSFWEVLRKNAKDTMAFMKKNKQKLIDAFKSQSAEDIYPAREFFLERKSQGWKNYKKLYRFLRKKDGGSTWANRLHISCLGE
ncbi:uncharacterized protein NEMAJ01_1720 [Nematocida major]|uniref:uncharacterized protein n=1 Tax=Nematocida major TaxID=1912982 RepID=UPI002007B480|nr:uncharacterized protein NEMAJ01_1720 [Nematocida major]KAH9386824.1 hypothetical protein NEMAJ01_1720 [Nematocida major]